MAQEMYFPPGEPRDEEDPRQLLHEFWRAHDRNQNAAYAERYVTFLPLLGRVTRLSTPEWTAFESLYRREHTRRRLPVGLQVDWMELAASRHRESRPPTSS
ncbi:MAG: hypothetical protein EPO26_01890 [Chloroflexota bacterium]|nr:MAG: hypothetical protein EPO26_01890 [Chloroflexota bacterium]